MNKTTDPYANNSTLSQDVTDSNVKEKLYRIVDMFLVEAKDQNGNERSIDRLNRDRHLAVKEIQEVIKQVEIDQLRDLHYKLSLIRDREDCPENIVEMIDDIRYSDFFNEIYNEEL